MKLRDNTEKSSVGKSGREEGSVDEGRRQFLRGVAHLAIGVVAGSAAGSVGGGLRAGYETALDLLNPPVLSVERYQPKAPPNIIPLILRADANEAAWADGRLRIVGYEPWLVWGKASGEPVVLLDGRRFIPGVNLEFSGATLSPDGKILVLDYKQEIREEESVRYSLKNVPNNVPLDLGDLYSGLGKTSGKMIVVRPETDKDRTYYFRLSRGQVPFFVRDSQNPDLWYTAVFSPQGGGAPYFSRSESGCVVVNDGADVFLLGLHRAPNGMRYVEIEALVKLPNFLDSGGKAEETKLIADLGAIAGFGPGVNDRYEIVSAHSLATPLFWDTVVTTPSGIMALPVRDTRRVRLGDGRVLSGELYSVLVTVYTELAPQPLKRITPLDFLRAQGGDPQNIPAGYRESLVFVVGSYGDDIIVGRYVAGTGGFWGNDGQVRDLGLYNLFTDHLSLIRCPDNIVGRDSVRQGPEGVWLKGADGEESLIDNDVLSYFAKYR